MKKYVLVGLVAAVVMGTCSCGKGEIKEDTVKLSSVKELTIDLTSPDITVMKGSENAIQYRMYENEGPEIKEDNGKVTVKTKKNSFLFDFGVNEEKTYVIVTLDSETLDKLDIDVTSGDIKITDLSFTGEVDATSGDVTVSGSSCGDLSIDCTSGDIKIDSCILDKASFEATSGDISVSNTSMGSSDFDVTSGDIALMLIGSQSDYNFDIETTSGNITLDGEKQGDECHLSGGSKTIKVDATSGDIDISFTLPADSTESSTEE